MYLPLTDIFNKSEWATREWAIQIDNNFQAIVGSSILPESITALSSRVTNVTSLVQDYQSIINSVRAEMDTLSKTVSDSIDVIQNEMDQLNSDIRNYTELENQKIWNNTGNKNDLYEYFNDPLNGQRRNLTSSINKLLDDLGYVNQLSTTHKITVVGSVNELDEELGDLSILSTVNNMKQTTIVDTLNKLNELIGVINNIATINTQNRGGSIEEILNKFDTMFGYFNDIDTYIRGTNYTTTFNNIKIKIGNVETITINGDDLSTKILTFYNSYLVKILELENKDIALNDEDAKIRIEFAEADDVIKAIIGNLSDVQPPYNDNSIVNILQKIILELEKNNGNITSINDNITDINDKIGDLSLISESYKGNDIVEIINNLVIKIKELEDRIIILENGNIT